MKAKIVLVALVAMMMVAVTMMPAVAVPATTQAQVTGSGTPPVFEEKFELNDDGDPLPNHGTAGTQVLPVPDGVKEVCVYVVARDPNGAADINRIWISVDNPLGVEIANGDTINSPTAISELTYAETCVATQAAVDQNLMTSARKTVIDGHVYASEWRMWKFCFDMGNCYISGDYEVTANANDGAGGTGTIVNTFEYISIKELAVDFTTIDYGEIVPGVKQIVSGDPNFGTAPPTVRNRANDPFKLQISATDMVGTDPNNEILATNLDAHVYGKDAPGGSAIDEELNLAYAPGILFSPIIDTCATETIDFSLLQDLICSDTYTGTITLEAVTPQP
jgi:hypothetical protein